MAAKDFPRPVNRVRIDEIDIGPNRARSLKPAQAQAIGAAIKADRQYDPITVVQLPGNSRFELVDGLHRLIGMKGEGFEEIEARLAPIDKASRRRQEILSGWVRAGHDIFDKAAQIKALADMARADAGVDAGDLRKYNGLRPKEQAEVDLSIMGKSLRWDVATAEALEITRSSVLRYIAIAKAFSSEQIAGLRNVGKASELNPLLSLARLTPEQFGKAVDRLINYPAVTIPDAIEWACEQKPVLPADKKYTAWRQALKRQPFEQRCAWVQEIFEENPGLYQAVRSKMEADGDA